MFFSKDEPIFEEEETWRDAGGYTPERIISRLLLVKAISTKDHAEMLNDHSWLRGIVPALAMVNGSTVHDIQIAFWGQPSDHCWRVRFYRTANGERIGLPEYQTVMNQRATFRWVAVPEDGITLRPSELLIPEVEVYSDSPLSPDKKLAEPIITTRSIDKKTKRMVINQTYYANA